MKNQTYNAHFQQQNQQPQHFFPIVHCSISKHSDGGHFHVAELLIAMCVYSVRLWSYTNNRLRFILEQFVYYVLFTKDGGSSTCFCERQQTGCNYLVF